MAPPPQGSLGPQPNPNIEIRDLETQSTYITSKSKSPLIPPFSKGGIQRQDGKKSPFRKGGFRGIFSQRREDYGQLQRVATFTIGRGALGLRLCGARKRSVTHGSSRSCLMLVFCFQISGNPKKVRMTKIRRSETTALCRRSHFERSNFEFVSDFVLRISNFQHVRRFIQALVIPFLLAGLAGRG
jgi:hypothetical protein